MQDVEEPKRYEQVAYRALEHWYRQPVELDLLKYRENAVFRIVTSGATDGVVRVHRPGYHNRQSLQSELTWTKALNAAGVHTPVPRASLDGDFIVELPGTGSEAPFLCDVIEWIDGKQLDSVTGETDTTEQELLSAYRVLGGIAARVHNQASAWTPPPDFKRHAWNAEGLLGECPVWGRFWELEALTKENVSILQAARSKLKAALELLGEDAQHYGLIHADMLAENILVTGTQVNLIDFDDCGFGWHLFEVATPLFFYLGEPVFDRMLEAFVAGYRQYRPLSDEHLQYLPLFLLARGFTYLGWFHTRKETDTAKELTPDVVETVVGLAMTYLDTP